jgi:SAM-dependent methyltransferase
MKWFVGNYLTPRCREKKLSVLDVGSMDVNGSYRHLFPAESYQYTGLDMEAGPNVDRVLVNPYDWSSMPTESFDVVISGQVFEHVEFFWITMAEMTRVLKKDGLICIIAPNGVREHRYPVDCYRFFTDGMVALARYVSLEILHAHTNCEPKNQNTRWNMPDIPDAMLIAQKPYSGETKIVNLKNYHCVPSDHCQLRGALVQAGFLYDDYVIKALMFLKKYRHLYICFYIFTVLLILVLLWLVIIQ